MKKIFQVSTLQALLLGYLQKVITTKELLEHGDIGLGTFENTDGEMIVVDHTVYKADVSGNITVANPEEGVPFAAVAHEKEGQEDIIENIENMEQLKVILNNTLDAEFGLNSMYVVRLEGHFDCVKARSEVGMKSHHVELSQILQTTQQDFQFENIEGTMVALYFPDYLDGINAPGWHLHFISSDRKKGGHVFELSSSKLTAKRIRLSGLEIQLPQDAAFDTYPLKSLSNNEVKKVEQSSK